MKIFYNRKGVHFCLGIVFAIGIFLSNSGWASPNLIKIKPNPTNNVVADDTIKVFMQDLRNVANFAQLDSLVTCGGADTLALLIYTNSPNPINDLKLTVKLPNGLEYGGFAYAGRPGSQIDPYDVSNPRRPVFNVPQLTTDHILIAYIAVKANCNADPSTSTYKITFEANYTINKNGISKNCKETYTPDTEYNNAVRVPVLNLLSVTPSAQTITTYNQASRCHTLSVSQDGIDAYLSKFDFYIDSLVFEPGFTLLSLKANNINLPYTYDATTHRLSAQVTGSYFMTNTDPLNRPKNSYFNTSEKLTLQACFNVTSCVNTDLRRYKYSVNYRCDDYQEVYCQEPSSQSATLRFIPNFGSTPKAESWLVQGGKVCGDNIIVGAKFQSVLTDSAMGIFENLVLKISNCQGNNIAIASVKVGGNPIPSTAYSFLNGYITVDFTKLTSDPDGVGIGLTDTDGDGKFDDLPGGRIVNMLIEFSVACPSLAGQVCVPNSCTFNNVSFTGLRHCGQAFQQTVNFTTPSGKPQATISYGSTTTNTPPDVVSSIPTYDFGTVGNGTSLAKTKNVEFCYTFSENNLSSCQNPSANYALVTFFSKTAQDVVLKNAVFAGSTPSNTPISIKSSSPSERTFKINLGNGLAGIQQCYSFDVTLDTNLCSPAFWSSIDFKVVEECGDCNCTILKACKSVLYYQDPNNIGCSCNINNSISVERYNYGYTTTSMTSKVDTSTIPKLDKIRFLPGDTMKVTSVHKVTRSVDFNDLAAPNSWLMRFVIYNRGTGANVAFYNRLRSRWDTRATKLMSLKVKKANGTVYNLRNAAFYNANPPYYEDDKAIFISGPDNGDNILQPAFDVPVAYSQANSSDDRQDGDAVFVDFRNWSGITNSTNVNSLNSTSNGVTPVLDLIGGIQNGDEFIVEWLIPVIRNPLFDATLSELPNIVTSRVAFQYYDNNSAQGIELTQQCSTETPYFFWDPKISVSTKVQINDCDASVDHVFKVSNPYPAGETWFTKEYRPFIGFEKMTSTIPAPFIYGGNAEWLRIGQNLGNGTVIEPNSVVDNPIQATYLGQDYFIPDASGANKLGIYYEDSEFTDGVNGGIWSTFNTQGFRPDGYAPGDDINLTGGSLPLLGIGLGITDSLKLHIPLLRLCPTPIGLNDFGINYNYSYPYLPNYDTYPFVKNEYPTNSGTSTVWGTGQISGYWYTNANRNESGNFHRFSGSQTGGQYLIIDNTQTFPSLIATLTSGLLVDLQGQNEVNTYTIEASNSIPTASPLTNVVTSISLPNSIQLIKVETSTGTNVPFSQVGATDTTKIYSFSNPNLAPGDIVSYKIYTEQLFCSLLPKICLTTVGGCSNPALTAAVLGQTDGSYCSSASDCYYYESEESGIQAEWNIEAKAEQDLCGEIQFGIRIKNVKPSLLMNLNTTWWLPKGMEYVPGSWEVSYPNGPTVQKPWVSIPDPTVSTTNTNLYGTAYTYTDDAIFSQFISDNGLKGISATSSVTDSNQISIRFKVKTLCEDFVSGTSLRFNVTAFGSCEQTENTGIVESSPLIIKNANPMNYAQILVVADPITLNCGATSSPLSLTGLNLSTFGSTHATKMCVTLPVGVTYVGSGFKFEAPTNFVPTNFDINTVGLSQELCFDLPDGIGPNQFFKLIIPVAADQNAACGKLELGVDINSYIAAQACVPNTTCGVNVLNTVNPIVPFEILGPLNIENLNLYTICGASPDTVDYEYSMTMSNPGPTYNSTVTFQLIQDLNGNGSADDFETPFDTATQTVNLANGASTVVTGTMSTPEAGSCPIIFKALYNTTCACDFREIFVTDVKPKFFASLGEKVVLCPGAKLEFPKCGDFTYTLTPSNGGVISETATTISVTLNDGFGLTTPISLTLSGNQSSCLITETIAIYGTEKFEIGPYTTQVVCATGSTLLDANLPLSLAGNVTLLWSPSTYLDDPTSETPTITNPVSDITYTITATNLDGKCSTSAQYPVLVGPLKIESTTVEACVKKNGTSYSDVKVVISWKQPAPINDSIMVSVGSEVRYIKQNEQTSPYTITLPFIADGSSGVIKAAYTKKPNCAETATFKLPLCCLRPECLGITVLKE